MLPFALYSDIQNLLVSASAIRHCVRGATPLMSKIGTPYPFVLGIIKLKKSPQMSKKRQKLLKYKNWVKSAKNSPNWVGRAIFELFDALIYMYKKWSNDTSLYDFTPFILSPCPKKVYHHTLSPIISQKSLPFPHLKKLIPLANCGCDVPVGFSTVPLLTHVTQILHHTLVVASTIFIPSSSRFNCLVATRL
jgi:hypothetical protein